MRDDELKKIVTEKYGRAALQATTGKSSCCGLTPCDGTGVTAPNPITSDLYAEAERRELPEAAFLASLGCGNPTVLAHLNPGDVVLDLGSGGGIDVLLSAKRVGPTGTVFGLDMTPEMVALAQENQKKSGLQNVVFLKGEIESIPLPDNSVDVIISNCVINLSAEKDQVLREAFRVLRPGGRLAVSDVVLRGQVPAPLRKNLELWIGCIAGALEESEYRAKLLKAGFTGISLEPTRVYPLADAREMLARAGIDVASIAQGMDGRFASEFIRATKPK